MDNANPIRSDARHMYQSLISSLRIPRNVRSQNKAQAPPSATTLTELSHHNTNDANPGADPLHPSTDNSFQNKSGFRNPRIDSFPKAPSSVEPPHINPYRFLETPAASAEQGQKLSTHKKHDYEQRPIYETQATPIDSMQRERKDASDAAKNETPTSPAITSLFDIDSLTEMISSPISQQGDRTRPFFISAADALKPKPPDEVVQDVEEIRHGTTDDELAGESAYQVEIAPPVRRRTPPPAIHLDLAETPQIQDEEQKHTNYSTWASGAGYAGLTTPSGQPPMDTPGAAGLLPPVNKIPMSTPRLGYPTQIPAERSVYDIKRPTCSLNLVCYRGGSEGCVLKQIQTTLESRFPDPESFRKTLLKNPRLIAADDQLFRELRRLYGMEMCGFWRRNLSLKTLRGLRVLAYSPVTRPVVVPLDDFVLQEMYYAYRHPSRIASTTEWIEWVFRLRRRNKRHALEFVEGWNSTRVVIAAALPWLISCLVGIIWTATGGEAQTAFTVASFILTSGTVIIALLAFISGIESSDHRYAPVGR